MCVNAHVTNTQTVAYFSMIFHMRFLFGARNAVINIQIQHKEAALNVCIHAGIKIGSNIYI